VWGAVRFLNAPVPLQVPPGIQGNVASIACGAQHIVALLKNGTVTAWGDAADEKLRIPTAAKPGTIRAISAGEKHSLYLLKDGRVLKAGVLPGVAQALVPLPGKASAIASGANHGVAIVDNGAKVSVFGDKSKGQGTIPAAVVKGTPITLVAAAESCTVAVTAKGVVVWGAEQSCGTPGITIRAASAAGKPAISAVRVGSATLDEEGIRVVYAAKYAGNSSWVTMEGAWKEWLSVSRVTGRPVLDVYPFPSVAGTGVSLLLRVKPDTSGAGSSVLELISDEDAAPPKELMSPKNVPLRSYCVTHSLAMAVTASGRVVIWTSHLSGDAENQQPPASIQGKVLSVACAGERAVAVLSAGGAVTFGDERGTNINRYGQQTVPAAAKPPATVTAADLGQFHTVYLVSGNVLQAGMFEGPRKNPLPAAVVSAGSKIIDVSAGQYCAAALGTDGKVYAWGMSNTNCRRGLPPELASGAAKATHIAAGYDHILALVNGGVMQWGGGFDGPLPDSLKHGVSAIAAGDGYSLAIKSGVVIGWPLEGLPCQTRIPKEAQKPKAACWVSAGNDHAVVRLCNGEHTIARWGTPVSRVLLRLLATVAFC
jgi:hypothetical protein